MATYYKWFTDQEKPGIPFEHKDRDGTVVDFSTGYTFTAKVCRNVAGVLTAVASQTGNITGAASSPNVTLAKWEAATLTAIAADLTALGASSANYEVHMYVKDPGTDDEVITSDSPLSVVFRAAAS